MADSHDSGHHEHGLGYKQYMVVFVALCVFTAVSFVVNFGVRHEWLSPSAGFALILGVAIVKAVLVGMYFMHLYLDWGKLYFFIFPTFILGSMMMVVFLPDIVLAWHAEPDTAMPARAGTSSAVHK